MIEVNFCPQCSAGKMGRFCSGCGANLDDLVALIGSATGTPPAPQEPSPVLPPASGGLVYGDGFDVNSDCGNCGSVTQLGNCELCAA